MTKLLDEFIKTICEILGCNPKWQHYLILTVLSLGIIGIIVKRILAIIRKVILWRNQRILNKDLHPYFSSRDVEAVTKFYIDLNYQNVAPSEDEEPGSKYIASAKNKIIPLFIKRVFKTTSDSSRFYLVLADSGMGKTTFMINLYIRYKNHLLFTINQPTYNIRLFPLGKTNILTDIKDVDNKRNTILLLDAFDEDLEAIDDYKFRLKEILEEVKNFRIVVITCRTNFFPSKEEEPHETGYYSFGEEGQYLFQKLYLSVFDNNDVKKYIRKRISIFWNYRKYRKALRIANKSPSLIVRPMLLNHINDLVHSGRDYFYSFEVYEELIERWLTRESNKPGMNKRFKNPEVLKHELHAFSLKFAEELYMMRTTYGGYFLPKGKRFSEKSLDISFFDKNEVLGEKEFKTKSLLNRDAYGNYKFSHKSILEYFLAVKCLRDFEFFNRFDFIGMDAANRFFYEMMNNRLRSTRRELPYYFYRVYFAQAVILAHFSSHLDWRYLSHFKSIKQLGLITKSTDQVFLVLVAANFFYRAEPLRISRFLTPQDASKPGNQIYFSKASKVLEEFISYTELIFERHNLSTLSNFLYSLETSRLKIRRTLLLKSIGIYKTHEDNPFEQRTLVSEKYEIAIKRLELTNKDNSIRQFHANEVAYLAIVNKKLEQLLYLMDKNRNLKIEIS